MVPVVDWDLRTVRFLLFFLNKNVVRSMVLLWMPKNLVFGLSFELNCLSLLIGQVIRLVLIVITVEVVPLDVKAIFNA